MNLAPTSFIGCLRHGWDLTPWDCIEMQLHALRPWIGWPCNECERPVTIELAPETTTRLMPLLEIEITRGRAAVKRLGQKMGLIPKQPRRTCPQGMSKAVARSLGLV